MTASSATLSGATLSGATLSGATLSGGVPPPVVRLLLVRHAATAATEQRRYSGKGSADADLPLSEEGERQAAALAALVGTAAPVGTTVVSSPLLRARRTAQVVAAALGVAALSDPDLVECDFGDWEGLTATEVAARWPAEWSRWWSSTGVGPPGGESLDQVAARACLALDRLCAGAYGSSVVVISHVTPLVSMLRKILDGGPALLYRLVLDPVGISAVEAYSDGQFSVRSVNDTGHLGSAGQVPGSVR